MVLLLPEAAAANDHSGAATTTNNNSSKEQQQQQHDDDDNDVDMDKKKKSNVDNASSNSSNSISSSIIINKTRVRDTLGYVGTVMYIGSVASAKDESVVYAGIVWDDTSRGKHNGTVVCRRTKRLVRHFDCHDCQLSLSPTAASFIKLTKLDTGRLLTPDLVLERYVPLDSSECVAPNELLPHTAQTASGRNDKPIQFLGEMQIRQHLQVQQLHHLSLRRLGICGIDMNNANVADWSSLFRKQRDDNNHDNNNDDDVVVPLTHLDLAGNLLSDWQSVSEILNVFTALAKAALDTLNLSWNRLGDLSSSSCSLLSTNTTLTIVNLQACHIQTLETLIYLGQSWTHLQELGLAKCNFAQVCCQQQNTQQNINEQSFSTMTSTAAASTLSLSSSPRVMNESQQETTRIRGGIDNKDNIQRNNTHDYNNNNNHDYYSCSPIDMDIVHLYQQQLTRNLMHIRCLDLSSCQLHSPKQVLVFAKLPVLQSLSLDDNPIHQLPCRTCDSGDGGVDGDNTTITTIHDCCLFPALRHLQLAGTQIADWTSGLDDFFLGCRDCRAKRTTTMTTTTTTTTSCNDDDEDTKTSRSAPPPPPPPLQSLRFRSTPLSERLGAAATRVTLIARYGSSSFHTAATTTTGPSPEQQPLSVINATVVTNTERIQAERRYVTTMCRLLAQQQHDAKHELQTKSHCNNISVDEQMKIMEESFWQEHPMLPLLLERHQTAAVCGSSGITGTGISGRGVGVGAGVLADSIITVSLQSMTASSCEKPPLIRRLPLTLTILQVKTMLARHYGLDVDLQQLTYVAAAATAASTTTTAHEASNGEQNNSSLLASTSSTGLLPTIMDDDEATLGYFGVDDGAVIYMHEIDVAERQLQQTREKAEFDMKLQQQQADWEARLGTEKKEQS